MLLRKFYCIVTFIPTEQLVLVLKMLKKVEIKHFLKPQALYSRGTWMAENKVRCFASLLGLLHHFPFVVSKQKTFDEQQKKKKILWLTLKAVNR